jgi:hypothetical protein
MTTTTEREAKVCDIDCGRFMFRVRVTSIFESSFVVVFSGHSTIGGKGGKGGKGYDDDYSGKGGKGK